MDVRSISTHCARTEFVGTTVLDTIGLVISGIDPQLLKEMNIGTRYHALGLLSSRTGAAGQITAVDDAVKATSTEVLSIDLPPGYQGLGRPRKLYRPWRRRCVRRTSGHRDRPGADGEIRRRALYQPVRPPGIRVFRQRGSRPHQSFRRRTRPGFRFHGRFPRRPSGSSWRISP